ncbi:MAG: hypothetical protein JSR61_03420 [Proteobacteria bacterium]|nr:hypothetical protein [Pseudomonadota bacterium]
MSMFISRKDPDEPVTLNIDGKIERNDNSSTVPPDYFDAAEYSSTLRLVRDAAFNNRMTMRIDWRGVATTAALRRTL